MSAGRGRGVALALLSASAFGVMPVLTKIVYADGAEPFGVLAVRFSVAGWSCCCWPARPGSPSPAVGSWAASSLLGAAGYAVQSLCYFLALERISAGLTALLLYVHPAMVVAAGGGAHPHPPADAVAGLRRRGLARHGAHPRAARQRAG